MSGCLQQRRKNAQNNSVQLHNPQLHTLPTDDSVQTGCTCDPCLLPTGKKTQLQWVMEEHCQGWQQLPPPSMLCVTANNSSSLPLGYSPGVQLKNALKEENAKEKSGRSRKQRGTREDGGRKARIQVCPSSGFAMHCTRRTQAQGAT